MTALQWVLLRMQTLNWEVASDCNHSFHQTQDLTTQVKSNSIKGLYCFKIPGSQLARSFTQTNAYSMHMNLYYIRFCESTPISTCTDIFWKIGQKNINRSCQSANCHALIELCSNILMVLKVSWCMFTMMYQSSGIFTWLKLEQTPGR